MTTSARYWRINITAYSTYPSLATLEFADTGGAAHTGGTPIESGHFGTLVPANAFDNDPTTCWAAGATSPAWIGMDFGSAVTVNVVRMLGRYGGYDGTLVGSDQYPTAFDVDSSSDGVTWNTEWSTTGLGSMPYLTSYPRPGQGKVLWRVTTTAVDGAASWAQSEIEFRTVNGGSDQTVPGGVALGTENTTTVSGTPAGNAVDDDTSTYFLTAITRSFTYEFAAAKAIVQVGIRARTGIANQSAKDFTIKSSSDGMSWTTEMTQTGETGWSPGELRLFPPNTGGGGPTFRVAGFIG